MYGNKKCRLAEKANVHALGACIGFDLAEAFQDHCSVLFS
jgi:hypothetical protein